MGDGLAGASGYTYEYRMCMLFMVRGYTRGLKNFRLRYQVPESEVGRFDDVVFDEGGEKYQVIQLRNTIQLHREKGAEVKINSSKLFYEMFFGDFNLLKYVKSYFSTLKDKVDTAVVLTTIDFDIQNDQINLVSNGKDWYKEFTRIRVRPFTPEENAIFDTSSTFSDARYYKFDNDQNIVHILKRQSETVSKELREKLSWQKQTKHNKKHELETNKTYRNQLKKLREKNEALTNFLEDLSEDDIREALEHIVYAIRQPNATELEEIIKNEIKDYFKLQSVDLVYNTLEKIIAKWCNDKLPFVAEMHNPFVIQFRDAEIFFQQNVKNVSFGDCVPISSFAGRLDELESIRKYFSEEQGDSIAIIGVGGIGKTELTKQFIKEYGQSDFYGRVTWINAESDESVNKSFRALAEKIDIPDRENKSTTTIIDQIFDYFHEVKVLFVFDNLEKSYEYAGESSNDKEKKFVTYCLKVARGSKHRPYFIFTSRNRECFPGVFSFDLSALTKEDANKLIKNELKVTNYTDENVEELTMALQYFPLALQEAIAYINNQHVSGGDYDIEKYLNEFAEKKEKLLSYPYEYDWLMRMLP